MTESPVTQRIVTESGAKQRVEAVQRGILRILALRFGTMPVGVEERVQQTVDEDRLSVLFEQAVCCASLEGFGVRLD